jgi:hypothetical protein
MEGLTIQPVVKKISKTIEKIPGLGPLLESLMESIQGSFEFIMPDVSSSTRIVFIFTTLEVR